MDLEINNTSEQESLQQEIEQAVFESLEEELTTKHFDSPNELPLFPVLRRPFFPGMAAPIVIEPGAYYETLKQIAKTEDKCLGLFLTRSEVVDIYKLSVADLYPIGVQARILRVIPMEQGGAQIILNMEKRITLGEAVEESPCLKAKVLYQEDAVDLTTELKAYAISIISTIKELLKLNPLFREELQIFLGHSDFTEPGRLADFAVALTTASREELQEILATFDLSERISKALVILKKELDISLIQSAINKKVDSAIAKNQKEFFLREQLKTIKRELGLERDDKALDREKFEARIKERQISEDLMKVLKEEMDKLAALEPHSPDYGVSRSYLDWLTTIPWGLYSQESNELGPARVVLEEDHYGLTEVKERILEFIAVGKLSGGVKGSIICLVGPPGVGKTSLGKSIARALNRKFYRFSVGGMRDEAEIKGHRRTYIGAMPGKLIQALKYCQVMNPVIMLDEIDKIGVSYHGDPASALLEALDPEQNGAFLDHYLDVRCDLSHVLFIVTANVLDTIPEPLKDRMELLRLPGYILDEKMEIAKRYLIPRNQAQMGIKPEEVEFTSPAMYEMINSYAREAGVRSLENIIKKTLRKIAVTIVQEEEEGKKDKKGRKKKKASVKHVIDTPNLNKYLGKPLFTSDRLYPDTQVGVAVGLAWTSLGGVTLYVEALGVEGEKSSMKFTGQAGNVMKESSEIAWSYAHSFASKQATPRPFFPNTSVHLHIPEGATPKDGPSAGITMVTAFLSLLTNVPIKKNLGMTGELTITGRVLAVGGIKEKLNAANRFGLTEVILPEDNRRDYEELPEAVKKNIAVHFVKYYEEVYQLAFPS